MNDIDTLDGFYKIVNDSFFYISQWDINNYDTMDFECRTRIAPKPYVLFSSHWVKRFGIDKYRCDRIKNRPIIFLDSMRNVIEPKGLINDSTYIFNHYAQNYDSPKGSWIRTFYLSLDLEIIRMETQNKYPDAYFFYD